MRYFIIAYSYSMNGVSGDGNLYFSSPKHPSNSWIEEQALQGSSGNVVVTNIIELSEDDYNEFIK